MRKELIGAASAIALMTGAAFAQGTSTPDPSTTPAIPPAAADGMPAAGAVSAEEMIGEDVMGSDGEKIGSVEDVIIDPASGEATQLVISSGGFLGIGEKYHPLPWSTLTYDIAQGGYVVDMTREQLQDAPSYGAEDGIDFNDDAYGRRVYDYYKAPYWNVGF